jgi:glycosyltransferase involved in cell wall biosynthesis
MIARSSRTATPDGVLLCGPWPVPRYSIFEIVRSLLADLHRRGRKVCYLCDGFGLRDQLGPDAVCFLEFPEDEPFDWETAFRQKRDYSSLSALLEEDRQRSPSLLAQVGIVQTHLDQLVFGSGHPQNSKQFEQVLAAYLSGRTGQRPRLIRARHDDMEGNLTGLMRLSGIDYVALDRAGREKILAGEVDLWTVVPEHVARNRELLRSWGFDDKSLDEAAHHAWWCLHQLYRWRHEVAHFDAVVLLTRKEVDDVRALLLCDETRNLTAVHNAASFVPSSRDRIDQLLYDYHHHRGLACYRGSRLDREPIAFTPADRKVTFVGRTTRAKGPYEVAESLRNLYHSGRKNVRGIFVGDFWPELRREITAVDPDHAGEYLLFTGPVTNVNELASLYAFGDLTALASHYEPMALVGLESYLMGTPCVVTEGTGAGDAYVDNPRRHGLEIARPVRRRHREGIARYHGVDVGSLMEQIAFLIDNPLTAWQMAEDGRRFVQEHYSVERMGEKYLELYDLLLAGAPADQLRA